MQTTPPLTRKHHTPGPGQPLTRDLEITFNRCHEFCGPSRRTLALMLAAKMSGPVLWIRPSWQAEQLMGQGVQRYMDPGRIIFAEPRRVEDVLWSMEEGLRAGCVPLVVAECERPPALTPIRRLHLAAETGASFGKTRPIGLLLTPGDGGGQGVESRWHLTPRHTEDDTSWLLQRRRARLAPPAAWILRWIKGEAVTEPVGEVTIAAE